MIRVVRVKRPDPQDIIPGSFPGKFFINLTGSGARNSGGKVTPVRVDIEYY